MSSNRIEIHAESTPFRRSIDLYIGQADASGSLIGIVEPVVFKERQNCTQVEAPSVSLRFDSAQVLMDELWRCGLRPTEGIGSAGSMAATQQHLADMKKIAFGLLKKGGIDV